jgi:hypothetical protein
VVGFVLTLLYIVAVARAIHGHKVLRKFYVLLLNRSLGDAFACLCTFANVAYVFSATRVK